MGRDPRRLHLGRHATAADIRAGLARQSLHVIGDRAHLGDVFCILVQRRVCRVEAVDIRQEDQRIGHDQLGNSRGQPVVIAVTDFFGGDGVVLVDNGNDRAFEQTAERTAGIEEAAPVLGVVRRQKDLCCRDAMPRKRLLVGMCEPYLPCSGRGLQILEPGAPYVDSEYGTADRDRAR